MTLNFNVNIVESNNIISQRIADALLPQVNKYMDNIYRQIQNTIPNIVVDSIMNQPEYESLLSGQLKAEFGLPDSGQRLGEILSSIKNSSNLVRKNASVVNGKISAGIKFQMIRSNFDDLLSLGSATFTTEKGSTLNWLQWLLVEGDTVIISDYDFIAGPYPTSRTGLGIMNKFGGAFWRVPPEFAGNIKNNWITRALDSASTIIAQQLETILRS